MTQSKIIGLDGKDFDVNSINIDSEENLLPNEEAIQLLETALKAAKKGYIQEVITTCVLSDDTTHTSMAIIPEYNLTLFGELQESALMYRDSCIPENWEEYDE